MEQDIYRLDDKSGEINPYCEIIVKNKAEEIIQFYLRWNSGQY